MSMLGTIRGLLDRIPDPIGLLTAWWFRATWLAPVRTRLERACRAFAAYHWLWLLVGVEVAVAVRPPVFERHMSADGMPMVVVGALLYVIGTQFGRDGEHVTMLRFWAVLGALFASIIVGIAANCLVSTLLSSDLPIDDLIPFRVDSETVEQAGVTVGVLWFPFFYLHLVRAQSLAARWRLWIVMASLTGMALLSSSMFEPREDDARDRLLVAAVLVLLTGVVLTTITVRRRGRDWPAPRPLRLAVPLFVFCAIVWGWHVRDVRQHDVWRMAEQGDNAHLQALIEASPGYITAWRPDDGASPLHLAADVDTAKLLLDAGADVNALDIERRSPLDCARKRGDDKLAAYLIQHGAWPDPLDFVKDSNEAE